ncbi:MAG TPA: MerR family DNA-binding protein [Caulobacteraceae bacterium]|nr:MerR family DNA-binding protein [Caulobacteraceae bacterium]
MTIAKLAQSAGVGVETVRYYQRRGIMPQPQRERPFGGGVRRYGEAEVRRLRFIRAAQAAGFTLEEIGVLLELDATRNRPRVRELAEGRIAALNQRIEELITARDSLSRLADTCSHSGEGPCPIITAFEA